MKRDWGGGPLGGGEDLELGMPRSGPGLTLLREVTGQNEAHSRPTQPPGARALEREDLRNSADKELMTARAYQSLPGISSTERGLPAGQEEDVCAGRPVLSSAGPGRC